MASASAGDGHSRLFQRIILQGLPTVMQNLDSNRMTLLYFAINGLHVLNKVESLSEDHVSEVSAWVQQQLIAATDEGAGFRSGPALDGSPYDVPHLAMTYSALALRNVLPNAFPVPETEILREVQRMQTSSGSFRPHAGSCEVDMRFLYCACAVASLCGGDPPFDVNAAVNCILACQTYEGGFAQSAGGEAHAGFTYCAIAALSAMNRLDALSVSSRKSLISWLLKRQVTGFQGRTGKPADTCYSFWCGATLCILGLPHLVDLKLLTDFNLRCAGAYGGVAKNEESPPDPMHTYLSLVGVHLLTVSRENSVIDPTLNTSAKRA